MLSASQQSHIFNEKGVILVDGWGVAEKNTLATTLFIMEKARELKRKTNNSKKAISTSSFFY